MAQVPIDIPPGLNSDDTTYSSSPAWVDGSHVRFRLGRPQTCGGWESITSTLLSGVCRAVFAWTDNSATLNIAAGTHTHLQLWQGGAVFDITPTGLAAGNIDGTGSSGYGVGGYGVGGYGEPSAADYFPRTWSLAAWGQKLLASPRNGTLYEWSNNTAAVATEITNAPDRITQMLVSPQRQVFALGCTQENGTWNPVCIRHSSVEDNTTWATSATASSTAREYILPGGGRIVGGKFVGRYLLVWTTQALFLGTYVGQLAEVWRFDKVGDKCGMIGPNAAAVLGSTAYWITPDKQFRAYGIGGMVQPLPCPIRADFADNLALGQADKIVASTTAAFGEIRWDYPDERDGFEVSRYIVACAEGPDAGSWHRGRTHQGVSPSRTARVDAGPAPNPIGVTYAGDLFWEESGASANGGALSWFLQSSDLYLDENNAFLVREAWPDVEPDQIGPVNLTISARMYAQSETSETAGPFTISSTQETLDFKIAGRLFQLTYEGYSAPSYARVGRLVLDAKPRGRRG